MADLEIKCPKCSKSTTVSEFVSAEALTCRSCGSALPQPQPADPKPKRRLKVHDFSVTEVGHEAEVGHQAADATDQSRIWPGRYRTRRPGRAKVRHHMYAWLVFGVLGGAMAFLRYGGGLGPHHLELLHRYAAYGLIACHLIVILKAFEDSVFQGVLCLLVPFYTLYYMFAVTDAVYMRSIVGAVLIGIGQDGFTVLQNRFFEICEVVRAWIARGG